MRSPLDTSLLFIIFVTSAAGIFLSGTNVSVSHLIPGLFVFAILCGLFAPVTRSTRAGFELAIILLIVWMIQHLVLSFLGNDELPALCSTLVLLPACGIGWLRMQSIYHEYPTLLPRIIVAAGIGLVIYLLPYVLAQRVAHTGLCFSLSISSSSCPTYITYQIGSQPAGIYSAFLVLVTAIFGKWYFHRAMASSTATVPIRSANRPYSGELPIRLGDDGELFVEIEEPEKPKRKQKYPDRKLTYAFVGIALGGIVVVSIMRFGSVATGAQTTTSRSAVRPALPVARYDKINSLENISISPDGQTLGALYLTARGQALRTLTLPDLENVSPETIAWTPMNFSFHTMAFSPDGTLIAVFDGPMSDGIEVHGVDDLSVRFTVNGVYAAFSADSKTLAVVWNHGIDLWDIQSRHLNKTLSLPVNSVDRIAFSPDGKTLAALKGGTYYAAGELLIWQVADLDQPPLRYPIRDAYRFAYSPQGNLVAVTMKGGVQIVDLIDHTSETWKTTSEPFTLAFSLDGQWLALGDLSATHGSIEIWSVNTKRVIQRLTQYPGQADSLVFTLDGKYLLSTCLCNQIHVWDYKTGHVLSTFSIKP